MTLPPPGRHGGLQNRQQKKILESSSHACGESHVIMSIRPAILTAKLILLRSVVQALRRDQYGDTVKMY